MIKYAPTCTSAEPDKVLSMPLASSIWHRKTAAIKRYEQNGIVWIVVMVGVHHQHQGNC